MIRGILHRIAPTTSLQTFKRQNEEPVWWCCISVGPLWKVEGWISHSMPPTSCMWYDVDYAAMCLLLQWKLMSVGMRSLMMFHLYRTGLEGWMLNWSQYIVLLSPVFGMGQTTLCLLPQCKLTAGGKRNVMMLYLYNRTKHWEQRIWGCYLCTKLYLCWWEVECTINQSVFFLPSSVSATSLLPLLSK